VKINAWTSQIIRLGLYAMLLGFFVIGVQKLMGTVQPQLIKRTGV
jgi:hypothetical protein